MCVLGDDDVVVLVVQHATLAAHADAWHTAFETRMWACVAFRFAQQCASPADKVQRQGGAGLGQKKATKA